MNVRGRKAAKNAHARQRAHERLGINLTKKACDAIIKKIKNGNATLVEQLSDTRASWIVTYEGIQMRIIYDERVKSMITIMPVFQRDIWSEFVEE